MIRNTVPKPLCVCVCVDCVCVCVCVCVLHSPCYLKCIYNSSDSGRYAKIQLAEMSLLKTPWASVSELVTQGTRPIWSVERWHTCPSQTPCQSANVAGHPQPTCLQLEKARVHCSTDPYSLCTGLSCDDTMFTDLWLRNLWLKTECDWWTKNLYFTLSRCTRVSWCLCQYSVIDVFILVRTYVVCGVNVCRNTWVHMIKVWQLN